MGDGGVVLENLADLLSPLQFVVPLMRTEEEEQKQQLKAIRDSGSDCSEKPMSERNNSGSKPAVSAELEEGEVLSGEFDRPAASYFNNKWRRNETESSEFHNRNWRNNRGGYEGNNGYRNRGGFAQNRNRKGGEFEWGESAIEKRRKLESEQRHRNYSPRRTQTPEFQRQRLSSSITKCENYSTSPEQPQQPSNSDDVEPGEIQPDSDSNNGYPIESKRAEDSGSGARLDYSNNRYPYKNNSRGFHGGRYSYNSRHNNYDYSQNDRSYRHKERSPNYRERSPNNRERSPSYSDRPRQAGHRDRSPYHRYRRHDYNKDRERTPVQPDKSPHHNSFRKSRSNDRPDNSKEIGKNKEVVKTDPSKQPSKSNSTSNRSSEERETRSESVEALPPPPLLPPPLPPSPPPLAIAPPLPPPAPVTQANDTNVYSPTIQFDMEEDMDICDTPPHQNTISELPPAPQNMEEKPAKWFYLNHLGSEKGPAKLSEIKRLVETGNLQPDHMIKHEDSSQWMTVENAASPVPPPVTFTPPMILRENANNVRVTEKKTEEKKPVIVLPDLNAPGDELESEFIEEDLFGIDSRVEAVMKGKTLRSGAELEILSDALKTDFKPADLERWCEREGSGKTKPRAPESSKPHHPTATSAPAQHPSLRGGDWKRDSEKHKLILNDGFPTCMLPPRGPNFDPRLARKDLFTPKPPKKLDLPSWAFSSNEDGNSNNSSESGKHVRGTKGTLLPVTRINSCAILSKSQNQSQSQGQSQPFDYRTKPRGTATGTGTGTDRHLARSARSHSHETGPSSHHSGSKRHHNDSTESKPVHRCRVLSIPGDHVPTVDELSIHIGNWYYLDPTGQERGPYSYQELQDLVKRGLLVDQSSVFRKVDNSWLPAVKDSKVFNEGNSSSIFDVKHPQFAAYMRGKVHELVMKSFKTRELASAINEVLDPWITSKQPKEGTESHPFNSTVTKNSFGLVNDLSERAAKRARLMQDDDSDIWGEQDPVVSEMKNCSFEELCNETHLSDENTTKRGNINSNPWGYCLTKGILMRIFHHMKADMKSIQSSSATCKNWFDASKNYKNISQLVDLSSAGSKLNDMIFRSIMGDYDKRSVTTLVLSGCTNISPNALEESLRFFSKISFIDIRGCIQLRDLQAKFHDIRWVYLNTSIDSYFKMKSLTGHKPGGENSSGFRPGFYKRKVLGGARNDVISRDAQMKHWLQRKAQYEYRKMRDFVFGRLKEIMKANRSEFFVNKVASLEDKLRTGYYQRHGLSNLKDDISRMCREAMKEKSRGGDSGDVKQTVVSFIKLAKLLTDPKPPKDQQTETTLPKKEPSTDSKPTKKKQPTNKPSSEKKKIDRVIKRSLSKLKKRTTDSDSDSSEDFSGETDATSSDPESDTTSLSDVRNSFNDDSADYLTEREWGARMTKASLVPPVTRKYEVIDEYLVVADEEEVKKKMTVALPDDYEEKLPLQKNAGSGNTGSGNTEELVDMLELPEVKEYKPRKSLGAEVVEQEVYGIDPYTHNLLLDSMPDEQNWPLTDKQVFIEEMMSKALNRQVRQFTGSGNTPMVYPLQPVIEEMQKEAEENCDTKIIKMCSAILRAMRNRPDDNYVAYRKGLGVVCNKEEGIGVDDFVVEFLGEVYPAWRWYEKQDGIRALQKNSQEPAPEFYNIYLERPKGDRDGYDLVVVDAMHKANYASRICHSCRPNCEAKVTAVDGQYQIGVYAIRPISYGEEITFDYNSVTESKEEYEASVCLCGSQICRGSYLSLASEDAFENALQESHGILDRHKLMLEACEANYVSEQDYIDLAKAGLGTCLLSGLPNWLVSYSAGLVRFINLERTKLPEEILKRNLEEKKKYFSDVHIDNEKLEAEIQAEGVYNTRLQNLALTLDKVRYVMRKIYTDPQKAPPPLVKLTAEERINAIWKGEGSVVSELLKSIGPHMDSDEFAELKTKVRLHDPTGGGSDLRRSLLWLRDELRGLECSYKCRHDAAADLIHMYAYTKVLFKIREYKTVKSDPVFISPLDMGPKYADKLGSGLHEYSKVYNSNYILGQLIYWYSQTNAEPDSRLARARKGCLSLPDISSFYVKGSKVVGERVYGTRTVRFMLSRMEKQPQRPWPKDRIWAFENNRKYFGSPMMDMVLSGNSILDKQMFNWLKTRSNVFHG